MPSHVEDKSTGLAVLWIVLRYLSALAAAAALGIAAALVFCVAMSGGAEAFQQWVQAGAPQHDPTFPGVAWVMALAFLGCAGLAPALWAASKLQGQARRHGCIALTVGLVLTPLVAGFVVCLAVVVAAWLTTAIALP